MKPLITLVALWAMFLSGAVVASHIVHAQDPAKTPYQITQVIPCIGHMDVSVAGQSVVCFGSDGGFISVNGAAAVQFAPPAAAGAASLTINGTTKALPGPFTISAGQAQISAQ